MYVLVNHDYNATYKDTISGSGLSELYMWTRDYAKMIMALVE